MDTKKPYLSKTLWVNLILAVLAMLAPGAKDFIVGNPQAVVVAFTVVNMILRLVTKSKIQLTDDSAQADAQAAQTPPSA